MLSLPLSVSSSSRDVTTPPATRRPVLETGRWLPFTSLLILVACSSEAPLGPTAAMLVVSGLPNSVLAGVAANAVVTAKDASGNTATGYTGTVHFTATDPAAALPPDYTFVSADAGSHTFPVTLKTAGSAVVTATDVANSSITGNQAVTVPALSDKPLYVANYYTTGTITVYAAGARCNATPTATIAGSNTGLNHPVGVALDAAGRLYVANSALSTITVYMAGATGNATPTATIAGSNTGLNSPHGTALDAAGQLYVGNYASSTITVYAAGATGNATPTATIAGSNTGLNGPVAIALDGAGRLYVANLTLPGSSVQTITVYAAGATGNATPTATIAGSNTGLSGPFGIALDAAGRLYVANNGVAGGPGSITVYAAGATGNATPTATIPGSNAGLTDPEAIALDAAGQLYVANYASSTITVYAAGATGNATPTATIAGSNTGLNYPGSITF